MAVASTLSTLVHSLRRLVMVALVVVLSVSLAACGGAQAKVPGISPDDLATITRQAEGFLSARDRLPELAALVNARDWTFTRNLIHGPMQEVGREMLYINKLLPAVERPEANALATQLDALESEEPERPQLAAPPAKALPILPTAGELALVNARKLTLDNPAAVANIVKTWINGDAPA